MKQLGRNLHEILRREHLKYEMSRAQQDVRLEELQHIKAAVQHVECPITMVNPCCVPGCDGTCMQAKSIHPTDINPRASLAPWTTSWQGYINLKNSWRCSIKAEVDVGGRIAPDTWSCFKLKEAISKNEYVWHQMTMFIRWRPKEQNTFILCSDLSETLQEALNRRISGIDPSDPYTWHAVFLDELRECYDDCVWKLRYLVREAEKFRDVYQPMGPDFPKLHDIARHVIHSNETLDVAIETIDSILHEHELLISREGSTGSHQIQKINAEDVTRRLYYHSREIRAIKARSASLYDRLQNEINLTLFGMNFFNFSVDENTGKQTFAMSHKFWIYWAISLPVTAAVILAWVIYDRSYLITETLQPLLVKYMEKFYSLFRRRKVKQVNSSSPS
ncbi:hypothetical protein I7I51_06734 [Histoplasma capsulatum]|uniref:Uncharacterized protein n=1 Tax=Ajellomyces capsulatus TaxID=5037 RepID=A0A8A1MML9_AJECA|nr:hypothetical protein I7I51_06734 [Histoplasma capsulatum]